MPASLEWGLHGTEEAHITQSAPLEFILFVKAFEDEGQGIPGDILSNELALSH